MTVRPDVVVLGSGVIGLSTGIRLAEGGARVLVRTAAPPARTTSALASAMVGPNLSPPDDPQHAWTDETLRVLRAEPMPGVAVRDGTLAARPAGATPPFAERTPGFRPLADDERPAGFGTAFAVRLPLVDMPVYLAYLLGRLREAGGAVREEPVGSLDEAAALAPVVVNCTGLAARALTGDPDLHPVRGPRIVVRNPGLDRFFMEAPMAPTWASIFPHGDHVVLGGAQRRSDDTTPDPAEAADILARCAAIEPALAGAEVLEHTVGLRPGRAAPRVEAERRGGALVVHNYGHAGNGVMLSWGCARDAAALALGAPPA
ncbi:D-amino-acid:oxygen oxidoreductase (deaminating) [Micromonospora sediminicola]|uniref:D-amino-acid oxidase n=1 Tax=Micromonospora sediminicola TaxID=946078 RepID=A0A1A9BF07_9ACTN|nr:MULTISPECIES: FAD-dependent oxidoreductase [Micromonospora]PGH45820.1 FAD-binding oxidoreductase [Micromonospora sp. WMMA1996]SBT67763.1 D-amino-acid:oxygen oxidoreductase (deaminating) [Micromonospora sediminicola]